MVLKNLENSIIRGEISIEVWLKAIVIVEVKITLLNIAKILLIYTILEKIF